MDHKNLRWVYLFTLSLVWGSSFILMKKALIGLSPIQVGALRILISSLFVFLIGFGRVFKIKKQYWKYLILNALIGTFFPAFLFAYAIDRIDSSIASILNSFTPLNTLIFGAVIFSIGFKKRQLLGVIIGFIGTLILILKGAEVNPNQNYYYAILILIASVGYALNVNIIKKYLHQLDALSITVANFLIITIPTLVVFWYTTSNNNFTFTPQIKESLVYVTVLAVFGTGLAKIMYNRLIQISTPIFSSSVTYIIPIVAITFGLLDGEKITFLQFFAAAIILFGVFLVNKAK